MIQDLSFTFFAFATQLFSTPVLSLNDLVAEVIQPQQPSSAFYKQPCYCLVAGGS